MIQYCLRNGIELTRSRPYRKNDQAWIEQKNGAIVRKLLGYRRFEGIAAAQVFVRLYGASRLFVNFFQPSFKLAEKHATIITAQLPIEHWHGWIGDATIADAILDRLLHHAHRLTLKGESLRRAGKTPKTRTDPETSVTD